MSEPEGQWSEDMYYQDPQQQGMMGADQQWGQQWGGDPNFQVRLFFICTLYIDYFCTLKKVLGLK